jgi:glutaminyl-peptide cyclotransferase
MNKLISTAFALLAIVSFTSCGDDDPKPAGEETVSTVKNDVKIISYNIIAEYPHDTASYTEGLEFFNGKLYESGGDYANSVLQFGDVKTGAINKKHKMGTETIFGEGITILNNKIYQLTYQTHDVFVYDVKDITKVIQQFNWPYEGWGLTNNGTDLIITTGGTDLYFVDPATFKVKNTVHIHDASGPVDSVNELEYVDGFIWANIYTTKDIVKIDPQTGSIVGKMNFNTLPDPKDFVAGRTDYFNGIAYNKESKTFFVTGKRWNKIYELRLN